MFHLPPGFKGYFDYEEGIDAAKSKGKPCLLILLDMAVLIVGEWKKMCGLIQK